MTTTTSEFTTEQIQAVRDYLKAKHEAYMQGGKYDDFAESLYGKMDKGLSDKQLAAIIGRINRDAERAAEQAKAADCPIGKTDVTGKVVSCKFRHNQFGGAYKMTVVAQTGYRVYISAPKAYAIYSDSDAQALVGQAVRFTATLQPSKDDPKFGFGSRPQGAIKVAS